MFVLLGDDKRTVVALKDVRIKYLMLILEYVYCGSIDLEPEDVKEFLIVANSLQIKIQIETDDHEMISQETLMKTISSKTVEMDDSRSDLNLEQSCDTSGVLPLEHSSSSMKSTTSLGMSEKKLNKNTATVKKTVKEHLPKQLKEEPVEKSPLIARKRLQKPPRNATKASVSKGCLVGECAHCSKYFREKDRTYHEKFCWQNRERIISDCVFCPKKFEVPSKLRNHMKDFHPEEN